MSDPIQHELDRVFSALKKQHPDYNYNQLESRMYAFLSSQMSKFRHRVNNPDQYTGIEYDPDGKLKGNNVIDINDYNYLEVETRFFSSKIPQC